jgi:hypothetical protein
MIRTKIAALVGSNDIFRIPLTLETCERKTQKEATLGIRHIYAHSKLCVCSGEDEDFGKCAPELLIFDFNIYIYYNLTAI